MAQGMTPQELSILFISLTEKLEKDPDCHADILNLIFKLIISLQLEIMDVGIIKVLCKGIIPFTGPKYPADIGIVTWKIMAQLYLYEGLPEMITSLGVTSVPESLLDAADESLEMKLRELNKSLKQCSIGQSFAEEIPILVEEKGNNTEKKTDFKKPGAGSVIATLEYDTTMNSVEETRLNSSSVKAIPDQRPWHKISHRWRPKLEMLVNMSRNKLERVNNLTFCASSEYIIGKGSNGTEVFLGLRDDGTEVAIKRMTKSNYQLLKNEAEFLRLPQLESPNIVRYVDFAEDENFGYLVLQLCEYTLEEYIQDHLPEDPQEKKIILKTKSKEVLTSLEVLHHQSTKVLHRDIKPQNVLIDIQGKARLADFGISRRLTVDQTTIYTSPAGTKCWTAKEVLESVEDGKTGGFKRSSDIQSVGMLAYYTLSCGHHPFGKGSRCETNILDGKYSVDLVEDLAKDLIEQMIQPEPKDRPKVEQTLTHPYFWENGRKVEYLIKVGSEKETENFRNADKKLLEELKKYTVNKTFSDWRNKFPCELVRKLDEKQRVPYPENTLALLRFIRNVYHHHAADVDKIDLMTMFPDLFESVYKFAKIKHWNSRPSLKKFFNE